MTKDISRGINEIRYNLLNLPMKMRISNSRGDATQWYVYGADGRKLRAFIDMGLNDLKRDYVGNRICENGSLKRILVDGGYIQDGIYCFFIVDHLGNTRVVAKANGDILQSNHYYPYGQSFAEGSEDSDQPYKYNGKELDSNLGLNFYDYGARSMDVIYNRFTTIDPLSEKYPHISPYAYCIGNPIKYVDPDGMDWYSVINTDGEGSKTTQYLYTEQYRSQNDLNKEGVEGTYIGIVGNTADGSKYLSLFGAKVKNQTSSGQTNLIAKMVQNIDNAIINSYRADYMNANPENPMFPEYHTGATNMGVSMTVTPAMVSSGSNVFNFSYFGGNIRYEVNNDMSGQTFDWQTGKIERVGGYGHSIGTGANAVVQRGRENRSVNWLFPTTQSWQNARNTARKLLNGRQW